jgi:ubiquinone/menaquinone biosynthesis C-methylase UbiE
MSSKLDEKAMTFLADPITKKDALLNGEFTKVTLKNTPGYSEWKTGQEIYEKQEEQSLYNSQKFENYLLEIERDRPVYERFNLSGNILDVGGGAGTIREFIHQEKCFISVDPFENVENRTPPEKIKAYKCLTQPLNYIEGCAEFLPIKTNSMDWVHMRSMLDHVQIPDLALIEANRVLKESGSLLIGLKMETSRYGKESKWLALRELIKLFVGYTISPKYRDYHIWHPTYKNLIKLVEENKFKINDIYFQPGYDGRVVYLHAKK